MAFTLLNKNFILCLTGNIFINLSFQSFQVRLKIYVYRDMDPEITQGTEE